MNDDLKVEAQALVAQYCLQGLDGMSNAETQLLLSEKELMLGKVSEKCSQGVDLYRNVLLKKILEHDVKEIGQAVKEGNQQIDRGMER